MDVISPETVTIDGLSGEMSTETGRYVKRLGELLGIYKDGEAARLKISAENDPVVYEVIEYKKDGSDLFFGTTTMHPGKVGDEYFMTRGHFHKRHDMGEIYYTQSGEGVLLMETRDGTSKVLKMRPGDCCYIPPDWAHRSVNTGPKKLVFVWVCNIAAGNDYAYILTRGMRKRAVERNGVLEIIDNIAL